MTDDLVAQRLGEIQDALNGLIRAQAEQGATIAGHAATLDRLTEKMDTVYGIIQQAKGAKVAIWVLISLGVLISGWWTFGRQILGALQGR